MSHAFVWEGWAVTPVDLELDERHDLATDLHQALWDQRDQFTVRY